MKSHVDVPSLNNSNSTFCVSLKVTKDKFDFSDDFKNLKTIRKKVTRTNMVIRVNLY